MPMLTGLDVFAVKNGEPMWVGSAETLEDSLELAVTHGDGLYLVYSPQSGHKNFYSVAQQIPVKKVSEALDSK